MLTSLFVTQTGHAARQTAEGAMLTEIGKPMLGIESGKNFPARMVGCSSSNDWPLVYAKYTFSGSKNVPMGLDPILAAAFGERVAVCNFPLGTVQSAAFAIAGGAVPLQVTDMGIGSPAAGLHARDSGLDDDAAHPLSRPPINGHSLELIGRGLAPANPAAPPLLGTLADASRTSSAAQPG